MKILRKLLLGLVVLVALFVAIGFFLPRQVTVERTTAIDAPAATVYTLVNSYTRFNDWSPWAARDPDTQYTYTGPRSGVGAAMAWHSENPDVGSGKQEIIESVAYEQVVTQLDFDGMGTALASFWLKPLEQGTQVTWRFETDFGNDLIGRWMGLMFERWIGADYEQGLANLKALAESYPKVDLAALDIADVDIPAQSLLLANRSASMEEEAMIAAMADAYGSLRAFLDANGVVPAGPAMAITREWNEENGSWTFDAAYPLPADAALDAADSGLRIENGWSGRALRATVQGADYAESAATYERIALYMSLNGYETAGDSWESYRSDPLSTPPEELVTDIFFPVR